jgi:DNA-binding transcriptional MerR regulator
MASYHIGEVERLLGVKSHTLRYWEKEVPLLQPRKDAFGRRAYSGRDVSLLLRLKHLLYERRFTIEGAREQLLLERSGGRQDLRALADSVRSELVAAYFLCRRLRAEAAAALDPADRESVPEETDNDA